MKQRINYSTELINLPYTDEDMYHNVVQNGHTYHQLESIETMKKSLSLYDDKKWIKKNGYVFIT